MINSQNPNFDIKLLDEAVEFLEGLSAKAQARIFKDMDKSRYELNPSVFKKLENTSLWEFRSSYMRIEYRFLAFWDESSKSHNRASIHGLVLLLILIFQ